MIIDTHSQMSPGLRPTPGPSSKAQSPKPKVGSLDLGPETLDVSAQNIASAISPLQDAPAARAAIQAVRQSFFANPASALLAQANQLPENALQLLQ